MVFKDFKKLVDLVNVELGPFCNEFQYARKELSGAGRTAGNDELFGNIKEEEGWAINKGGGTEVQYHIGFDDQALEIRYGIGFNTQYVQFANEMSMVEYVKPFMQAFLELNDQITTQLPNYKFVYKDRDWLVNPQNGEYCLFGNTITVSTTTQGYSMSDQSFEGLINDLKKQFIPYKLIFQRRNSNIKTNINMDNFMKLLKYKNQIILQGPPGTGKTREAKLIAESLIQSNELSVTEIMGMLEIGMEFATPTGSLFRIEEKHPDKVKIRPKNGTSADPYSVPYLTIQEAVKSKFWVGPQVNGIDSYKAGISKYIYFKRIEMFSKLIQFHPAYSYEDFVRGIVADSGDDGITYEPKNKILAEFSEDAHKNFMASKKDIESLTKEKQVEESFREFVETIEEAILKKGKYVLNESVYLIGTDREAFRFKGDNWAYHLRGLRMKFKDILLMYFYKIENTKQLKQNREISGLAKGNSTYFLLLLEKFKEYLNANKKTDVKVDVEKERNYVLIIDEINRANLPAVLGELIYGLEYRGEPVDSMYEIDGDRKITLPPNLFIIGTMNTADRSVGHIDYAIRRRFAFANILPKAIPELTVKGKELFNKVALLFCEEFREGDDTLTNSKYLAPDFKPTDVILGHSYFLIKPEEREKLKIEDDKILELKLQYEIKPILKEYVKDGILSKEAEDKIGEL